MQDLHRFIVDHYDLNELKTLCFNLGVNFDALPGDGTVAKARELVVYLGRRGKLERLVDALHQGRLEPFEAAGLGEVAVEALYIEVQFRDLSRSVLHDPEIPNH